MTQYMIYSPLPYLPRGEVNNSLPEDPIPESAEQEPFGMELTRFSNEAIRTDWCWIGNPYFEDTVVKDRLLHQRMSGID